jgi:hypothetical protein
VARHATLNTTRDGLMARYFTGPMISLIPALGPLSKHRLLKRRDNGGDGADKMGPLGSFPRLIHAVVWCPSQRLIESSKNSMSPRSPY